MKKDLLDALGAVAREQERSVESERWEALARGELSPAQVAEIEREAADDPETAELLELYRPIDAEARARIVERLAPPAPTPIPLWKRVPWVVVPVAAAAALMIWLMQPARLAPLPEYRALAEGGQSIERAGPAAEGPLVLGPDSVLTLVLRPATDVAGNVEARFFVGEGDALSEVPLRAERATAGSLRVQAKASEVFGARRGDLRLVAVVGRPEALASGALNKAKAAPDRGSGWQRVSVEVRLSDPE